MIIKNSMPNFLNANNSFILKDEDFHFIPSTLDSKENKNHSFRLT